MKTELEVVYNILNVARAAEHNNDEPVTENLVRSFVRNHRADSIRKYYKNGHVIQDEVFQKVPLEIVLLQNNEYKALLPKIIRLDNHYGFYIEKNGITIPIVATEQYNLSKRNPFGKNFLQCKTEGNELYITTFNPADNSNIDSLSENYLLIQSIIDEIYAQQIFNYNNPTEAKPIFISVSFYACLVDPSDCPTYDWENDIFPFPQEKCVELENQVLAKEFGIMSNSKKDEIQNARGDEIRYHDTEQINNQ